MSGRCEGVDPEYIKEVGGITRKECEDAGGKWVDGDDGFCFVRNVLTRALGETMLELGTTYKIAQDFRDQILAETAVGRHFLEHYYANLDKTFTAVRENYLLVGNFVNVWLTVLPWVQGMLEANGAGDWMGQDRYVEWVRFSDTAHASFLDLIHGFQKSSPDQEYTELLEEVSTEVARYAGLSPREALVVLRREPEPERK
jgi:hypothetical protein